MTKRRIIIVSVSVFALIWIAAGALLLLRQNLVSPGDLIETDYEVCAEQGELVQRYLATGEPIELDPAWAEVRAQILERPKDARSGLIRAEAVMVIKDCEEELRAREARAAAEREAERLRQIAAEEAAALAAEEERRKQVYAEACKERGGYISEFYENCLVDYPNWEGQPVALKEDGSFDHEAAEDEKRYCEQEKEYAQQSAEDGYPYQEEPRYYEETGVCWPGRP